MANSEFSNTSERFNQPVQSVWVKAAFVYTTMCSNVFATGNVVPSR